MPHKGKLPILFSFSSKKQFQIDQRHNYDGVFSVNEIKNIDKST